MKDINKVLNNSLTLRHLDKVKSLIERGANPNYLNLSGENCLGSCTDVVVLDYLLSCGAKYDIINIYNTSMIEHIIWVLSVKEFDYLVNKYNIDLNYVNPITHRNLFYNSITVKMFDYLVSKCVDYNHISKDYNLLGYYKHIKSDLKEKLQNLLIADNRRQLIKVFLDN